VSTFDDLSPVLRVVDRHHRIEPASQVVWAVRLGREGATEPGVLQQLTHTLILATNTRDPQARLVLNLEVPLTPVGDVWPLHGKLRCVVGCLPGRERDLVSRLAGAPAPRAELERRLRSWVALAAQNAQAEDLDERLGSIGREVHERAARELGLAMEVHLAPKAPPQSKVLVVEHTFFSADAWRAQQADKLKLLAEVELRPTPRRGWLALRAAAANAHHTAARAAVESWLEGQGYHQVTMTDPAALARQIWEVVGPAVAPWGFGVGKVRVEPPAPPSELRPRIAPHVYSYKHREVVKPVEIRTELQMEITDLGLWVTRGRPPLEAWAHKALGEAIQRTLFEIKRVDFLRGFRPQRQQIEQLVREAAKAIGCSLLAMVTVTGLEADTLRDWFRVQLERSFSTRLRGVDVPLRVSLLCKIPNPEQNKRVASLLADDTSVVERMGQDLAGALEAYLRDVGPEQVYLYFDHVAGEGQPTPRQALTERIRRWADLQYGALIEDVRIDLQVNPIVDGLLSLRRHDYPIEGAARIQSLQENLTFAGRLAVTGVALHAWGRFVETLPEPEKLAEVAVSCIASTLADYGPRDLSLASKDMIALELTRVLTARLEELYGLTVVFQDLQLGGLEIWEHKAAVDKADFKHQVTAQAKLRALERDDQFKRLSDLLERRQELERALRDDLSPGQAAAHRAMLGEVTQQIAVLQPEGSATADPFQGTRLIKRRHD
jgi:hypothetical protein